MANYRYLGYGITNEQGIATLDHDANGDPITHSYTGTGAGELDIIASLDDSSKISDSSIQSEICEVGDYFVYDKAITNEKSPYWNANGVSESVADDGTTLTGAVNRYTSTKALTGDFELLVEMKNDGNFRFGLVDSNVSKLKEVFMNSPNWSLFKLVRTGNTIKAYQSSNQGSTWTELSFTTSTLTTEDAYFYMHILVADRTITYRNLKAYQI